MKNRIAFSALLISFLILQSCRSKEQIPNIHLRKVKSISSAITPEGDSTFFRSFTQITQHNNLIYASDTQNDRILVFDTLMNIYRVIGSTGSGPGEFKFCGDFDIYHDSLFVYDNSNKRVEVFDINGNYSRSFILEKNASIMNRFCIAGNGLLYVSTPSLEKPISVFNNSGKIVKQFGEWVHAKTEKSRVSRNHRKLVISENKLISVLVEYPEIEIYSLKGNLINKIDLSNYTNFFDSRLEHIKKEISKGNNGPGHLSYVLIDDLYVDNNFLYLGYNIQITGNRVNSNQILVLKLTDNNIDIVKNLILTNSINDYYWSLSFCYSQNSLYSFDLVTETFNKFVK